MKKFVKFAAGAAALAGAVCGVLYFLQKVLGVDIFKKDTDDIDDFDDDFNWDDDVGNSEEKDDLKKQMSEIPKAEFSTNLEDDFM